jgi:formate/nitrite transporter FocA (FNT family)
VFEFFSFSRLFLWISVVQITVFYIVLYAFLAGFFIALLTVFYQTLNDHEPKWTMGSSLIGNSPGESIKFDNCS